MHSHSTQEHKPREVCLGHEAICINVVEGGHSLLQKTVNAYLSYCHPEAKTCMCFRKPETRVCACVHV